MGSTRKRRSWHGDTVPAPEPAQEGFPRWEHSSLTFEGEIERLGAIGRNVSTAPRWTRIVARVVALLILVPFAVALVLYLLRFLGF